MDHCHGQLAALTLDHHFRARADVSQHRREVAGGFLFRDVDHIVSHGAIIPLSFLLIFVFHIDCPDRESITMICALTLHRPTLFPPQAGALPAHYKSVMRRGFSDPDDLMPRPITRFARENRTLASGLARWSPESTTSFAAIPARSA